MSSMSLRPPYLLQVRTCQKDRGQRLRRQLTCVQCLDPHIPVGVFLSITIPHVTIGSDRAEINQSDAWAKFDGGFSRSS